MQSLPSLISRIKLEYECLPGLKLTTEQARRLWAIDADTCGAALDALIAEGFLQRTGSGKFIALPRPSGRSARVGETAMAAVRCPHCQKLNTFDGDDAALFTSSTTFRCVACRQVVSLTALSA